MNTAQFDCRWCGKPPHEHGTPGESPMGGPKDRLCPCCDSYGNAVTSQFYVPKVQLHLEAARKDLRTIKARVETALAWLNEVLDA
jgi:hypothetical protein